MGLGLLLFSPLHLELPAGKGPPGPKDGVGLGDSHSLFVSRGGRAPPFLLSACQLPASSAGDTGKRSLTSVN